MKNTEGGLFIIEVGFLLFLGFNRILYARNEVLKILLNPKNIKNPTSKTPNTEGAILFQRQLR